MLYKVTDKKARTGDVQWGENISHVISRMERSIDLHSNGILVVHENLNLALLLTPINSNFDPCLVWEAQGEIVARDWQRCGCHELATIRKVPMPEWFDDESLKRKVQLQSAILWAELVVGIYEAEYPSSKRPREAIEVAKGYLAGNDCPSATLYTAACRASEAAYTTDPTAKACAYSAYTAAYAACAAAYAANDTARTVSYSVAHAALNAAGCVVDGAIEISFGAVADDAIAKVMNNR